MMGLGQNMQFKAGLESYVRAGGTLLVFSQQHGSDFEVLPTPNGQQIGGYGWLEDNSCFTNAAYVEKFHAALASQASALVTSNIDGYFDSIPSESTVLLRRVKNGLPAMFLYPYGQGWVVVSSSYDDWGGFNQTGPGARAIIRDLIAWAKKPQDLPLNAPGATASVELAIKNHVPLPATQVKLTLLSPSRDRVISEQTVPLAVEASGTATLPFSFTFPATAELGIYHVDYELLDDAGVTIQPVAETDSGRIVVAKPLTGSSYRPGDVLLSIVMPGGEDVFEGSQATFRYRLANNASTDRRFRLYWDFFHGPATFVGEVAVPAGTAWCRTSRSGSLPPARVASGCTCTRWAGRRTPRQAGFTSPGRRAPINSRTARASVSTGRRRPSPAGSSRSSTCRTSRYGSQCAPSRLASCRGAARSASGAARNSWNGSSR